MFVGMGLYVLKLFVVFFFFFIVALGDQTGRIQLPPVDLRQLQRLFPSGVCLCDLERD